MANWTLSSAGIATEFPRQSNGRIFLLLAMAIAGAHLSGCKEQFKGLRGDRWVKVENPQDGETEDPLIFQKKQGVELGWCPATNVLIPREECDRLMKIVLGLEKGLGAFEAPERMKLGDTAIVTFGALRRDAQVGAREVLGVEPDATQEIQVSNEMAAELTGIGFEIAPRGVQRKKLESESQTWTWQVKALDAPSHELRLKAYVILQSPRGEREDFVRTFKRDIVVDVPISTRVENFLDHSTRWLTKGTNWLKALGGFLLAALGVWAILRGRKPKEG